MAKKGMTLREIKSKFINYLPRNMQEMAVNGANMGAMVDAFCATLFDVQNQFVEPPRPVRNFTALDWYYISGRGHVACVDVGDNVDPYDVKPGDEVIIDGNEYLIRGVEHMGNNPKIGILIRGDRVQ